MFVRIKREQDELMKSRPIIFYNGTVVLPDQVIENGAVVCLDGRIQQVIPARRTSLPKEAVWVNAKGGFITPGFVDLHVHGGAGADFMDGSTDAVRTVTRAHARHGTTTIFPTTTTGSRRQLFAMLQACKDVQKNFDSGSGARIAGVHFYGPYFAKERVGCHLRQGRRNPDAREYIRDFNLGIIQIVTCAAELPGAAAFYREARRRKYFITCGHSDANWTHMAAAFKEGMRHVDHFWCAMSSVTSLRQRDGTPMQASMEEFVLMNKEMSTEVLADGQHLSRELLEYAFVMKGSKRLCLVTDANRALDMPPGRYRFGPKENGEWFRSNGKVGYQPGAGLASSVVGMDTMVRNMKKMTTALIYDVIRMATLTPAERAGISRDVGSLETGKRADILILSKNMSIQKVFIGGHQFYVKDQPNLH